MAVPQESLKTKPHESELAVFVLGFNDAYDGTRDLHFAVGNGGVVKDVARILA